MPKLFSSALISKAFARHEARTLLLNPATPIFLGFAWALASILTFYVGGFYASNQTDAQILLGYLPWVLALIIPALTMHTWAEDWRRGTAERMLTLPIPLATLHLTRFATYMVLLALFLAGTWPFLATLAWLGSPDWGPIATGYLGIWLLAGVLLAADLFIAALSPSYVVAFVGAFALNGVLLLSGWSGLLAYLESWLPGRATTLLQQTSLLEHLTRFLSGTLDTRAILFLTGLILLFLTLGYLILRRRAQQQAQPARTSWFLIPGSCLLLLASPLANLKLDATSDHLYTLSPATVKLLEKLPQPATLTVYTSRNNPDIPPAMRQLNTRLDDLIGQLQSAAPGKLKVVRVNPDASMETELKTLQAGIQPQPLPTSEDIYLGLTASLGEGGRTALIPALEPSRTPYLEFDLASLLAETVKTRRKSITVLSSLNLNDENLRPRFLSELEGFYNISILRPGEPVVPEGTDVLLVMDAPFLPEESLYAVDQYMLRGGRTLMLLDPAMRTAPDDATRAPDRNADTLGTDHPADLLRRWGVAYDWNQVVGDPARATPISQRGATPGLAEDATLGLGYTTYPLWLSLDATNVNRKLPFTTYVSRMVLPESGFLVPTGAPIGAGLSYEAVLQTTPNARTVTRQQLDTVAAEALGTMLTRADAGKPAVRDLAALLTGPFPTTFAEVPESVKTYYRDYATDPAAATWPSQTTVARAPGALLVVADADFTDDTFSLARQQSTLPGQPLHGEGQLVPINDNLVFLYNGIQYLAGEGDLLGLRGKAVTPRTFTRVEGMLEGLSKKYVLTEQRIAAELFTTGSRLAELQKRADDATLADARATQEIRAWQSRDIALKKQLRQLRRALRGDVMRLGHALAVANILTMPLLLLAGMAVFRYRRRRKAHRP